MCHDITKTEEIRIHTPRMSHMMASAGSRAATATFAVSACMTAMAYVQGLRDTALLHRSMTGCITSPDSRARLYVVYMDGFAPEPRRLRQGFAGPQADY